jgi:Uma2 family endonuclease
MVTAAKIVTAEDLLHLPAADQRYELVQGVLRTMPPASGDHGMIAMRLGWRLGQYVETHGLGITQAAETGYLLATNPDTVRAPDLAFVRQDRIATMRTPGFWRGAPDLVAEVISPGDLYDDVTEKVWDWLEAGTRLVWVLNPRRRQITVYRSRDSVRILTDDDTLDGEDVVPGWSAPVRDLFAAF